jgi:hypothetical protein
MILTSVSAEDFLCGLDRSLHNYYQITTGHVHPNMI